MPSPRQELAALSRELLARLEESDESAWAPAAAPPTPPAPTPSSVRTAFETLREQVEACRKCPLGSQRLRSVFGVGDPKARVMFVGEGPGFQEDRQGEPFVGKA